MNSINTRLAALREVMKKTGLAAYIIPSTDPHQSEYVNDYWKIRTYFSDFTGSAGTLVVTLNEVALWVDSRYFLQVTKQCKDSEVTLFKQSIPHAPEHIPWLCDVLENNDTVGVDYRQFSKSQIDYLVENAEEKNIQIKNDATLIDSIWQDRPQLPTNQVAHQPIEFSGQSTQDKLQKIQAQITKEQADYYLISSLDEIAWLYNIRAHDVDFTPLVISYALVGRKESYLFCNKNRFNDTLLKTLKNDHITVIDYDALAEELPILTEGKTIITDPSSLNYSCFDAIKGTFIYQKSLVKELKAIKNNVEIANAKKCMEKDGVAMTQFFMWLESELQLREISEYEIGRKLDGFRQQQAHYKGESFSAIVSYKNNGAIIHYTAPKEGSAMVKNDGLLLIDSGAQYQNGTTDVTRTVFLGDTATEDEKKSFTLVLKGYITLETIQFPKGTVGMQLDSFSRMHLWKQGLNFGHGTGHGIGSYGMVHEDAQGFASSMTTSRGSEVHKENQFTTIEPGFYKEGAYGIRTENVVISYVKQTTSYGDFIGFEPITLFPIDTRLIDFKLMTSEEMDWLNSYHKKVLDTLSPILNATETTWLTEKCKPV
ncbi:MAG: aminopeptidase P family protein [Flavobacteriaceae bacterium]|nr:aminopeptidase P family protein [Flavobacteriaceae bacterium]